MYRVPSSQALEVRRGIILMVVLFMLTLFAIAGVSFVLYASAEATAARLHRDAGSLTDPDMDPELAFSYFLGQLIYDAWDDETGVYSALRGHSLARGIYGLDSTVNTTTGVFTASSNLAPFSGTGRLHYTINLPGIGPVDEHNLINYTYFEADGFLRDPERLNFRTGLRTWNAADNRGPFTGGFNASYTYPDLNNMFLAHVRTSDGRVMLPSFHRPWAGFGSLDPNNPNWTDTNNRLLKYLVLRPRPADHAGFPPPDDEGGDVKNLVGAPGGNDSIWLDIGAPVLTLPGGRKYKMLVAPLIIDLDGRINLNTHGNLMGPGQSHASNQGWGPWEVNLEKVLTAGGGTEWKNLFLGSGSDRPRIWGRYGKNQLPQNAGATTPTGATKPHFYGQVDYNAAPESAGTGSDLIQLPGAAGVPPGYFPLFPANRYNNGLDPTATGVAERNNHASRYHALRANTYLSTNDDRVFPASNMVALLQPNDTGSEAITSELLRLCPQNLADPRIRRLVTTHSLDRNQPGVHPYIYNTDIGDANVNQYPARMPGWDPSRFPVGSALPFPDLALRTTPPPGWIFPPRPPSTTSTQVTGEFGLNDWRTAGDPFRIDLNSTRTAYPLVPPRVYYNGRYDARDPDPKADTASLPGIASSSWSSIRSTAQSALTSRYNFLDGSAAVGTTDLYRRLLRVAGVPPCADPFRPTDEELVPRRWLAQLAVNIVDYLDEDDISTPFNFYSQIDAYYPNTRRTSGTIIDPPFDIGELSPRDPNDPDKKDPELPRYWVFGTELPRVVVNEVLVEHPLPPDPTAVESVPVNVWVELHNTMRVTSSTTVHQEDGFPVPLNVAALQPPLVSDSSHPSDPPNTDRSKAYAPYRIVVTNRLLPRPSNDNVLGAPDELRTSTTDQDFQNPVNRADGQPQAPVPAGGATVPSPYIDAQDGPSGSTFFLLGPGPDARNTLKAQSQQGRVPDATPFLQAPSLRYPVKYAAANQPTPDDRERGVTVLLRRLANPHLPHNPWPTVTRQVGTVTHIDRNPYYNPYVTVDYLEANPLRNSGQQGAVYASRGKRHPYAAFFKVTDPATPLAPAPNSPVVEQELTAPPPPPDPPPETVHNFGQTNTPLPLSGRYEWLVHLDRNLVTATELLHVSAYQPHLLTQRFIQGDDRDPAQKFRHYANWFDQGLAGTNTSHRLYRLFEYLHTKDRLTGVSDSQVPGKINLNSVWDPEVFMALCDPANPVYFSAADVTAVFNQMIQARSPTGVPAQGDRPFWGAATGQAPPSTQHPRGIGIEDTLLCSFNRAGEPRRLFQPPIPPPTDPASHPYMQYQLLTKVFDNITTRSNVFAVWATVGFFEVVDDKVNPAKLGKEIGRDEGRNVRHRMFAIINRSVLTSNSGPSTVNARFNPHTNSTVLYFSIIK